MDEQDEMRDAERRGPTGTWNEPDRIDAHRRMDPGQRMRLAIEVSRAALRFAEAPRHSHDAR